MPRAKKAQRRRQPKDPEDTKGGVRGTHGLGDAPRARRDAHPVAMQGGSASRAGATSAKAAPHLDDREAGRLEREQGVDPEVEAEEQYEHGLTTRITPGPGPKDRAEGRARAKDLDERALRRKD